jgi:4-amino-4-deoxy-L-arabinose transferase-like glycosyltransferase
MGRHELARDQPQHRGPLINHGAGSDQKMTRVTVAGVTLFALIITLNVLCLGRYPAVGGDEVIIGANALNLVRHGALARPIYHGSGFPVFDCFPPVAPILMAASYAAFGFGVIQTKLPGLILGVVTAIILFLVTDRIAGRRPAIVATSVFILDPVTFTTWQSGRDDSAFLFFVAASIFVGCVTIGAEKGRRRGLWFLAGALTGIAAAAYYPFAAAAVLISLLGLWALVWCDANLRIRDKLSASAWFATGLAAISIGVGVWISNHFAYCREQILGMAPSYLAFGAVLRAVLDEWRRYWEYATREAGFPNLALGIVSLAMIFWLVRRRWELAVPGVGVIGFAAFLSIYAEKDSRYLATLVLLGCIGLAVVYREIDSGRLPKLGRWVVRPLVCLSIAIGLIRSAIVAFTLIYQWHGRDYRAFDAKVRALVPHDARVIGPQTVWYALANDDTDLWLYTQGGERFADVTGETAMNDSRALADITYILIDERQTANRLSGLCEYVRTNFRRVATVSPSFAPLPWAKVGPLDVEIYARDGEGEH